MRKQLRQADCFFALGTRIYGEKTKCKVSTHFEAKWWQESLGAFSGVHATAVGHKSFDGRTKDKMVTNRF